MPFMIIMSTKKVSDEVFFFFLVSAGKKTSFFVFVCSFVFDVLSCFIMVVVVVVIVSFPVAIVVRHSFGPKGNDHL